MTVPPRHLSVEELPRQKMAESIGYKGYRVEVCTILKGWRTSIYPPGSKTPLPESPSTLESSSKEAIIAEAKKIVDAHLSSRSS
jgi:hypothetical protein